MSSCLRRSKNSDKAAENEAFMMKNGEILLEKLIASSNGKYNPIRNFSTEEINISTNNFETGKVLIKDDYAYELYKGHLHDQVYRPIIVMKFKTDQRDAYEECINNIAFASQMCHKNILKLIGCCLDTQIPIFIFESVVYGTLDEHIHNPRELHFEPLLWTHRLKIAMEVANSLAYLHIGFSRPIVFSGIKPSGILLDENYVAKLFDFSQSKSIPAGESRVNVKYLKGTLGYIAPEYMEALVLNEKCDVYNFGGLLLLLLTGQRVHDLARGTKDEYVLSGYVKKHSENNRLFEIVDPIIVGDDQGLCPEKEQQLQDFKELALRCASVSPEDRPTMIDVAKQLRQLYQRSSI